MGCYYTSFVHYVLQYYPCKESGSCKIYSVFSLWTFKYLCYISQYINTHLWSLNLLMNYLVSCKIFIDPLVPDFFCGKGCVVKILCDYTFNKYV